MRAVLYLRLSVAQDDVISDSIRRQESDLRDLASREGWEVVQVLADDGLSGRKARANATEALRMLRDGEADVLAVWKLDRWTRQGLSAIGDLVTTLDTRPGALFVAFQDSLRSDQAGWRLLAAVLSEVARSEAESTAMRVSSAVWANRSAGRFVGGTVPFGYRSAPRAEGGRTLVTHPPELAVIQEVAARILAGESQASIIDDLTARKIPTTRSPYRFAEMKGLDPVGLDRGSWSYAGLAAVWTGESLLGRISRSRKVVDEGGRQRKVWELVRDADGLPLVAYPPLLDRSTVERLRLALRDPKRPASPRARRPRRARLLSGLIYCALCNARLWVSSHGGRIVYTCGRKSGRCPGPNMTVENADRAITEEYLSVVGHYPEVREVEETTSPESASALREIETALRETLAELASDSADEPAILRRVAILKGRRTDLRAAPVERSIRLIETGLTHSEAWELASMTERQGMLARAISHVTLTVTDTKGHTGYHPERLRIHWER
ncbi:recombinase family protein [Amnibacterium flavum]|uniref:Recombinase family protein n=1 Tax=Amnibacterium flavum TaxID=2173173 RepID=A0A2V1HMV2_9MICO|nr:recombinase family protein [Amnibacterium flavum]PVZ93858.1 hypothetical protein DDQ50_08740 [Amnibacterium flavum]